LIAIIRRYGGGNATGSGARPLEIRLRKGSRNAN